MRFAPSPPAARSRALPPRPPPRRFTTSFTGESIAPSSSSFALEVRSISFAMASSRSTRSVLSRSHRACSRRSESTSEVRSTTSPPAAFHAAGASPHALALASSRMRRAERGEVLASASASALSLLLLAPRVRIAATFFSAALAAARALRTSRCAFSFLSCAMRSFSASYGVCGIARARAATTPRASRSGDGGWGEGGQEEIVGIALVFNGSIFPSRFPRLPASERPKRISHSVSRGRRAPPPDERTRRHPAAVRARGDAAATTTARRVRAVDAAEQRQAAPRERRRRKSCGEDDDALFWRTARVPRRRRRRRIRRRRRARRRGKRAAGVVVLGGVLRGRRGARRRRGRGRRAVPERGASRARSTRIRSTSAVDARCDSCRSPSNFFLSSARPRLGSVLTPTPPPASSSSPYSS